MTTDWLAWRGWPGRISRLIFLVLPAIWLLGAVPLTPTGVGPRGFLFARLFALAGVSAEASVSGALLESLPGVSIVGLGALLLERAGVYPRA